MISKTITENELLCSSFEVQLHRSNEVQLHRSKVVRLHEPSELEKIRQIA